jgi:hypothetical protein
MPMGNPRCATTTITKNERELTMKVLIDNEIARLHRPLKPDEYRIRRELLKAYGCPWKLPVWSPDGGKTFLLVDGHHTREICLGEKITFEYQEMPFKSRAELIKWVEDNQLGRRNLEKDEYKLLLGRHYNKQKHAHGDQNRFPSGQNDHLGAGVATQGLTATENTAKKLAEQHGISEKTVRRAGEYAEAVDAGEKPLKPKKQKPPPTFKLERAEKLIKDFRHQCILFANEHICPSQHIEQMIADLMAAWRSWMDSIVPPPKGKVSQGKCSKCGREVQWVKTRKGKNMPLEVMECKTVSKQSYIIKDGICGREPGNPRYLSHFVTCNAEK